MPVAEKFEAEGVDNGFMSCLPKKNISFEDHWTTLSGWSKENTPADDAAKAVSIAESKRLAMLFYWNSYKLNVTQTLNGAPTSFPQGANSEDDARAYEGGSPVAQDALTPKSRVCRTNNYINAGDDAFESPVEYVYVDPFSIMRMYDGVTTNEDNFVGFGLDNDYPVDVLDENILHYVNLNGTGGTGGFVWDIDYSELPIVGSTDALHCVCYVEASGTGDNQVLDPSNRKVLEYDDPPSVYEIITQIVSLELYSYPT